MVYPNRLNDIIQMFGRSKSELSLISNNVVDFVFEQHKSLLSNLNVPWLAPEKLSEMVAKAVHEKGAALNNVWGFVNGTVRNIIVSHFSCLLFDRK